MLNIASSPFCSQLTVGLQEGKKKNSIYEKKKKRERNRERRKKSNKWPAEVDFCVSRLWFHSFTADADYVSQLAALEIRNGNTFVGILQVMKLENENEINILKLWRLEVKRH